MLKLGATDWHKIRPHFPTGNAQTKNADWNHADDKAYRQAVETLCQRLKTDFSVRVNTTKIKRTRQRTKTVSDWSRSLLLLQGEGTLENFTVHIWSTKRRLDQRKLRQADNRDFHSRSWRRRGESGAKSTKATQHKQISLKHTHIFSKAHCNEESMLADVYAHCNKENMLAHISACSDTWSHWKIRKLQIFSQQEHRHIPNKLAYKQMPQIKWWVNGVERAGNSVIRMDEIDPIPKLSGILVWSIWLNCQRKFHCTI